MKNLSPSLFRQVKLFILPLFTIIIVLLLTSYVLMPKISESQELLAKVDNEKRLQSVLDKKAQKLQSLESSSLLLDFTNLEYILPSKKDVVLIFDSMDRLEAENGVFIGSLSLKPGKLESEGQKIDTDETAASGIGTINFSTIVSGPQDGILAFLSNLQTSSPFFKINSISVNSTKGIIVASLNLSTFYQPLPATLGKIESSLSEMSASQKKALETVNSFHILQLTPFKEVTNQGTPSAQPTPAKSIFKI